uniref:Uncharacterized protein n=1 Tax=Cacopsylla melanoneura TaxID=428564 RepID=A0A8D8XEG6_9HEMI
MKTPPTQNTPTLHPKISYHHLLPPHKNPFLLHLSTHTPTLNPQSQTILLLLHLLLSEELPPPKNTHPLTLTNSHLLQIINSLPQSGIAYPLCLHLHPSQKLSRTTSFLPILKTLLSPRLNSSHFSFQKLPLAPSIPTSRSHPLEKAAQKRASQSALSALYRLSITTRVLTRVLRG